MAKQIEWSAGGYYNKYTFIPRVGVVQTTPMDRALGRSVNIPIEQARHGIEDKVQKEISSLPVFRDLLADTFFTYYLNDPELVETDTLPPEHRISQLLLSWMAMQPDSQTAKSMTTSSAPASTAAAMFSWRAMMTDEAFEAIRNAMKQLQQMKQDVQKQLSDEEQDERKQESEPQQCNNDSDDKPDEDEQQDSGGSGEQQEQEQEEEQQNGGSSDNGDEQQEKEEEQPQKSGAQMQQEYEEKSKKVEDAIHRMMGNPVTNGAMRAVAKQSHNKVEDMSAMAKAWGLDIGSMSVLDMTTIMELYENNREFITQLSNLIGRSEIASSSALQRVRESYIGNPTQINLTQDLTKVLPFEALLLSDMTPHIIRTQQVLDWANQGLLGWVDEAEGKTQGSFVAYVDGSGSMNGDRILAAKAVAFGLAKTLHEDRFEERAYIIKTFGTPNDGFIEIDENSKMDKVADWSGRYFGGGTNFDYCFSDCLKVMEDLEERDVLGTDLVFITDGEAQLSPENRTKWQEHVKRTGSRMIFVAVTNRDVENIRGGKQLEAMADLLIKVNPREFTSNPEKVIEQIVNVVAVQRKDEYLS